MAADNCKGQDYVPASLLFVSNFLYTFVVLLLEEKTVVWRMCLVNLPLWPSISDVTLLLLWLCSLG